MSAEASRPRVLVFAPLQPPDIPCGITTAVRSLAASRANEEFEFSLISTFTEDGERSLPNRLARGLAAFVTAWALILRSRPALVDIHTASGRSLLRHSVVLIAARSLRRPVVFRIHGGRFDRAYADAGRTQRAFIRWLLRLATRVVVLSEGWRERIQEIEPAARIEVLPNSVDCTSLAPTNRSQRVDARRVLLLANLCEQKGHYDALAALAKLVPEHPAIKLLLAGSDREPGATIKLQREAERLGIREHVEFLGVVSGTNKDALIRDSEILILPSHTENMPMVILEAMAASLPVVATTVGAIPEMIEDGVSGLLVGPRDPDALADRIALLLDDPELSRRLGRAARQRALALWDKDAVSATTVALFHGLLGSDGCGQERPLDPRDRHETSGAEQRGG